MKGDRTFLISVEKEGRCLAAGEAPGSRKYLQLLFSLCRLIDEKPITNCQVRIMAPDCKERVLVGRDIKDFANAARYAGLGFEKPSV